VQPAILTVTINGENIGVNIAVVLWQRLLLSEGDSGFEIIALTV
jgi:hypothetical protein